MMHILTVIAVIWIILGISVIAVFLAGLHLTGRDLDNEVGDDAPWDE
jgi:hypothetical protein